MAAASLGCLPNSRETVASAVLSCFGACITRLEVPPYFPGPLVVQITTQLFLSKTTFSPDLPFHSEKAKGVKSHEISYDTLTLKSSFKEPDASLWKFVSVGDW